MSFVGRDGFVEYAELLISDIPALHRQRKVGGFWVHRVVHGMMERTLHKH